MRIYEKTDRLFARLLLLQWLAGIAVALFISPQTWIGQSSSAHLHLWAAIFLGGAIAGLPLYLAWKQPGQVLNRHVIAVAQMLSSGLLIHLTGGRIETHFHTFGSLAFLAFYRDWRVLLTATIVTTADHMLRGWFWPQSVFGLFTAANWRWIEHASWVAFEDITCCEWPAGSGGSGHGRWRSRATPRRGRTKCAPSTTPRRGLRSPSRPPWHPTRPNPANC